MSNEQATVSTKTKLIGLSLSLCIMSILTGEIAEEQVVKIVTRTRCTNAADWNHVIDIYRREYWDADPDRGEQITRRLIAEGKIYQPRLEENQSQPDINPNGTMRIWVEDEAEITYIF